MEMTDYETIKAMIERAQERGGMSEQGDYIKREDGRPDNHPATISESVWFELQTIKVEAGYCGFVSEFRFTKDGDLIGISAWE